MVLVSGIQYSLMSKTRVTNMLSCDVAKWVHHWQSTEMGGVG